MTWPDRSQHPPAGDPDSFQRWPPPGAAQHRVAVLILEVSAGTPFASSRHEPNTEYHSGISRKLPARPNEPNAQYRTNPTTPAPDTKQSHWLRGAVPNEPNEAENADSDS